MLGKHKVTEGKPDAREKDHFTPERHTLRLVITCPDKKGLVAAVSSFFEQHDANILRIDQYLKPPPSSRFFMRMEVEAKGSGLQSSDFGRSFAPLARRYSMDWRMSYNERPKRMAVLVSKYDHCLIDLLWRWDSGELAAEIPLIVSNHPDLSARATSYGVPYFHLPVSKNTKSHQESRVLDLLARHRIDLVVLARYMQILTPHFIDAYPGRIINIHHSFLPAFVGANPYHRAHERGVKIIGATAHYVTEDLDAGPIISQDVVHVSHWDTAEDMMRVGRDVERRVLARAVRWHLEDRVLLDGNRTVVFT